MIKLSPNLERRIGFISSSILIFLLMLLLCPSSTVPSLAIENTPAAQSDLTTISIAAPTNINFDLTPIDSVTHQEISHEIIVSSNNPTGYSLFLSTTGSSSDLTSDDIANTMAITPICDQPCEKTLADFPDNSWGYYLTNDATSEIPNYQPVPNQSTNPVAVYSANQISTDHLNLNFAVAVTPELWADVYYGQIMLSALAHPKALTSLTDLSTMQELTSQICQDTPNYIDKDHYATKRLIDTRDNTAYWVAKLADGNCWMTQNLAYDYTGAYTALKQKVASTPASETWNYIDVSGPLWQPTLDLDTYEAETGHVQPIKLNNPTDASQGGEYDAHYLIGNYYNASMSRRVCPTGWDTPKISSASGSFYSLLSAYGLSEKTTNPETGYDIIRKPLHFIRTGEVDLSLSDPSKYSVSNGGRNGRYWSSNSYNGEVYDLYFTTSTNVSFTNLINAYNWGVPVRCMLLNQ